MEVTDEEVDRTARELIAEYGPRAAIIAVRRLNRCIDGRDWVSRDTWARIVHRIHENQHGLQSRNER